MAVFDIGININDPVLFSDNYAQISMRNFGYGDAKTYYNYPYEKAWQLQLTLLLQSSSSCSYSCWRQLLKGLTQNTVSALLRANHPEAWRRVRFQSDPAFSDSSYRNPPRVV